MPPVQLNNVLEYISFISRMRDIVTSEKVVQALWQASVVGWEKAVDADTGDHLIQGVFTSTGKSELTKSYIARLIKVYMTCTGMRLTAWTKDTISSDNTTNVAIGNRIAATMFENNLELFTLVVTRLIGMDNMLVKYALETEPSIKAKYLLDYLSADFDLSITSVVKDDLKGDQIVRQDNAELYPVAFSYLVESLERDAFTPDYFAEHINQASIFYRTSNVPGDLWDDFAALDPIVDVVLEHREHHGTVPAESDGAAVQLALQPPSGLVDAITNLEGGMPVISLALNDPDPIGTIRIAREAYFEANPHLRDVLSAAQLSVPQIVEAVRESSLTVAPAPLGVTSSEVKDVTRGKFGELELPDLPDEPVQINRDNGAEPVLNKVLENAEIPVATNTDGKGVPAVETDYTGSSKLSPNLDAATSLASVEIAENAYNNGAPPEALMKQTVVPVDFDMILEIDEGDNDPRTTVEVVLQNYNSVKIIVPASIESTTVEDDAINTMVNQAVAAGRNVVIDWNGKSEIEKALL